MKTLRRTRSDVTVMYNVPYKVYARLTYADENRHLKMAYHDRILETVSLRVRHHGEPSVWFRWIVVAICRHQSIKFKGTAGTTFHRSVGERMKGVGKEADESYYLASLDHLPTDREPDLDAGNPPPDLCVEVDHRVSSRGRLPVYARLGVPAVWRYRARTKNWNS